MVKEREPPSIYSGSQEPHTNTEQQSASNGLSRPEFGKVSTIRSLHDQPGVPFNIPKPNQQRPEHHRNVSGQSQHISTNASRPSGTSSSNRRNPLLSMTGVGADGGSGGERVSGASLTDDPLFNPFKPVKPSSYQSHQNKTLSSFPTAIRDGDSFRDAVGISRPTTLTWTTKAAPRPLFSSKPCPPKMSNSSKNLQNFIDLTTDVVGFATNARHSREELLGAMDTYSFVDAEKAQENIKALLEGAFEDEDGKQRPRRTTRARKKKIESNINNLAAQLDKISVSKAKQPHAKVDKNGSSNVKEEGDDEDVEEDEEEEEEEEEEGEEEVDDGTREGLKVKLLPHQIEGVAWMCDKELGQEKTRGVLPKGGILADDMGLGKTVQSIALLLANPRDHQKKQYEKVASESTETGKDEKSEVIVDKGTLIVAPLALIKQWESEISTKIEKSHRLDVCVYHGTSRTKYVDNLKEYDVVITTYGTLSSEHAATIKESSEKAVGLFALHWHRIILDEAHTIKNRNAKATQAACALEAEYRWCLTGTPLQNNLDELQSLIKFLRIKPYNDLAAWRDQITRPLNSGRGGLAITRLQVYLKAFMKRRTKDVLKQNDDLKPQDSTRKAEEKTPASNRFQITKREIIKVQAEFSPVELNFYKRLESRTESRLAEMMGGSRLDYAGALVLLLRLRQACNHPELVGGDLAEDKDILLNNHLPGSQKKGLKNDGLDNVADLFGGLSVVHKKCDICSIDLTSVEAKRGLSRCSPCEDTLKVDLKEAKKMKKDKHSRKKDAGKHKEGNISQNADARIARVRRNRPVIEDDDEDDEEAGAEWIVPPSQRTSLNTKKSGDTDDENRDGGGEWLGSDDSGANLSSMSHEVISLSDSTDSGSENGYESAGEGFDDLSNSDDDSRDLSASTKIRYLMKILRREAHDYKFIVFSVFTSMLDKIEPFLKGADIGYARYDGRMRNDLREASLDKLRNKAATRVLLCSLRAGSLGLNLTAASRVVILEPFWNPFIEEQAIDRVHRLNQTLDVKIYKITIKATVEERILSLQERKRQLANATIEGKVAASKLTIHDMMALFGREAELRFDHEHDQNLDLSQRTRLFGPADDEDDSLSYIESNSQSTSRSQTATDDMTPWSLPSSQSSARAGQADRKPNRPLRVDDSAYGRRW